MNRPGKPSHNGDSLRLGTERLILRPMLGADLDALLLIFTDPNVMAALHQSPFTREQVQRWLQRNLDHQDRFGYGLFSVLVKESGELIGDSGVEHMEDQAAAELGYDFRSDFWNRG